MALLNVIFCINMTPVRKVLTWQILQGTIHDSFAEAYESVNKMKADSGNGVSTRIILHNETPESLIFTSHDDYAGYWVVKPPAQVKCWGVKKHLMRFANINYPLFMILP